MRIGRTSMFGHLVEIRAGELSETVLVDGRRISHKLLGALRETSHFFDLVDAEGQVHACEAQIGSEGLLSTRVTLLADGRRVQRLRLRGGRVVDLHCPKCRYSMIGQVATGDSVRCPECGEITTLGALGVRHAADLTAPAEEHARPSTE